MCVRLLCGAKHRRGYLEEFIVLFPSYSSSTYVCLCDQSVGKLEAKYFLELEMLIPLALIRPFLVL